MSTRRLRVAVRELSVSAKLAALESEVAGLAPEAVLEAIAATARLAARLTARSVVLAAQEGREAPLPSPDLLDAKAAAQRLGVSLPTIYRLAANGELPVVRICGAARFEPAELERFVASSAAEIRQ